MPNQTHHPRRKRLMGRGYFRRLGPGFITGAADDDPSGIGTYSQVGAAWNYTLLWTAVISLPMVTAVQEASARLGLVTGKGLAALVKERFPRPVLWGAVALTATANIFNLGADLGSMAASLELVVPVPYLPSILALTALILGLELGFRYHRYARILKWLTLSLGAYIAVMAVVSVDWSAVARYTLLPDVSPTRGMLAALIAICGTTISPYLFFWQAGEEVEELEDKGSGAASEGDGGAPGEGDEVRGPHIRAMRYDVAGGMGSGILVMFAIMVASASTLGRQGITNIETADQAAQALKPIAGEFAGLLFTLGIIGTGLLAVPVLAGSTAYALSEAFGWHEGLSRSLRSAPGFYGTIIVAMGMGMAMNFSGLNPIRALYLAAILNGLAAPPLILLILLLSRSAAVMGEHRSGRLSVTVLSFTFLVMTALPLVYLAS